MSAVTILGGDCLSTLQRMLDDTFDCVVTSPPYWGLRDYGVDGQIGLEPTMQEYLDKMVVICRELRRVLKPEGTFWLNVGDCYSGSWGNQGRKETRGAQRPINGPMMQVVNDGRYASKGNNTGSLEKTGLKNKDLCMIPNRLAIALQDDGWFVRSEIIWHKPNPMPESVRDRPTSAHEKIWFLTKNQRYFYDADAIAEDSVLDEKARSRAKVTGRATTGWTQAIGNDRSTSGGFPSKETRNARNVWTITTKPFKGAHFATMPIDLAERCIKAGCPEGGHVLDPFGGAGTTTLAAARLNRNATIIELNGEYRNLAYDRIISNSDATVLEL